MNVNIFCKDEGKTVDLENIDVEIHQKWDRMSDINYEMAKSTLYKYSNKLRSDSDQREREAEEDAG